MINTNKQISNIYISKNKKSKKVKKKKKKKISKSFYRECFFHIPMFVAVYPKERFYVFVANLYLVLKDHHYQRVVIQ